MWIERYQKKANFIKSLVELDGQVLITRGARQVGKTSFILNALQGLSHYPQLKLNLMYPGSFRLNGVDYFGRDFFGKSETGEEFLKNLETELGGASQPSIVFIDEADQHPLFLESIQTLSQFTDKFKFIITGSNLENIVVKNAATGRKKYFDLFPITFDEFVCAGKHNKLLGVLSQASLSQPGVITEFHHKQLNELFKIYLRIGGMPRILTAYLGSPDGKNAIPEIIKDLAVSIEENVKTVLGEKSRLYEYEDVIRKLAQCSMNTLKYSHLQVQHAGRSEAKKLVAKTVGARVSHKIRLFESERDLSKYIIFDCGIANYLLNGSDLLKSRINDKDLAILCETFIGNELISGLTIRDDLLYWKSQNKAEVEFILRSPSVGIDVKTRKGDSKALNSLAIFEPSIEYLVKICDALPSLNLEYNAALHSIGKKRKVPFITLPHYLAGRLVELIKEISTSPDTALNLP